MRYAVHEKEMALELEGTFLVHVPVILLTMPERMSYTFEHVMELHFPANEKVTVCMLEKLYGQGVRPAEPGEFTRRAFLNGRMSLTQAESVSALIAAQSREQRQLALKSIQGEEGDFTNQLKNALFILRRDLEAVIDFPEEPDVDHLKSRWREHLKTIRHLLQFSQKQRGRPSHQSRMRVLVYGPANSGKSSLIKTLIPGSLPVVSHVPGTTLDLVPYSMQMSGEVLHIYDSPGVKDVENELDEISLRKLWGHMKGFDAVLWLRAVDQKEEVEEPPVEKCLKVISKSDLLEHTNAKSEGMCRFSAITGEGVSEILEKLDQWINEHKRPYVPFEALEKRIVALAEKKMQKVDSLLFQDEHCEELAAYEIDELLDELSQTLFEDKDGEELLNSIFKDFCIGK